LSPRTAEHAVGCEGRPLPSLIVRKAFALSSGEPGTVIINACRQVIAHGAIHKPPLRSHPRRAGFIHRSSVPGCCAVHMAVQHVAGPEDQDSARKYRHFFTGLRVAADPSPLCRTEKVRNPLILTDSPFPNALPMRSTHLPAKVESRLVPREADLCIDHLSNVGAGDREHIWTLCRFESATSRLRPKKSYGIRGLRRFLRSVSQPHSADPQVRPPPSRLQQNEVACNDPPVGARLGQRQGNRGCRCIGVPVHGHHHTLRRQLQFAPIASMMRLFA